MSGKTAFVFPGGGSQVSNPLDGFYEAWPEVERAIERLDDEDIRTLLFEADEEALNELLNMHRAVMASGYVVADAVTERFDVEPDVVAGHSTGHLTALPIAGAITPAEALEFVTGRSRSMIESADVRGPGKMVAVLLTESESIEDVVTKIEGVSIAAYNAPKQTVISGKSSAVDTACERLRENGPARTVELDVELAAHSSVVEGAVDWAEQELVDLSVSNPAVPVVSDVTGERYEEIAVARRDLPRQIVAPVQWMSIVETFEEMGVERVVEFPPAGVLTDFVSQITSNIEAISLTDPDVAREVFDER